MDHLIQFPHSLEGEMEAQSGESKDVKGDQPGLKGLGSNLESDTSGSCWPLHLSLVFVPPTPMAVGRDKLCCVHCEDQWL
jgi:hypothetical protein